MAAGGGQGLPREICKWLQSLDLSFNVKNAKRDLSNGFLVAEMMTRYYPKEINVLNFENGTRLAAKVDNWEQLYKFFKKKNMPIVKADFDPVIHCAQGYAVAFLFKLYNILTKRTVKQIALQESPKRNPAYMRDTASTRLKDTEIERVQDNIERTIRAIDTLGMYHEERRMLKAADAPTLMKHERRLKIGTPGQAHDSFGPQELQESTQFDEVRVKALTGGESQMRGGRGGRPGQGTQPHGIVAEGRAKLLKSVGNPTTSAGALAGLQQPALFVKPAADIMRPLVQTIIQENEELSRVIEAKKDIVVAFMEQCREGVPEELAVRVFETLANRAQLLVDTLTKSPPEFWKVWSTFCPALDFPESSPLFESAVFLFKRIGELMRDTEPQLTQQLITEVGLPPLARELSKSPEKREYLCEIIYSYTQEDTYNHLVVLRALKNMVSDLPVYVSCLACLISADAQRGLLDEHLLDLYIYYALVAMQSPQPKIRVAGISIVSTITMCSEQHQSILGLVPILSNLANDDWWEVQAQLLQLSAHLLSKLTVASRQEGPYSDVVDEDGRSMGASDLDDRTQRIVGDEVVAGMDGDPADTLLGIINHLFRVCSSKNVLQVGLSALVQLLQDFPNLLPMFVSVLLNQPPALRRRLLRPPDMEAGGRTGRIFYVHGNASHTYEEECITMLWPHLDVANTFVRLRVDQKETMNGFEVSDMEVLLASLPEQFVAYEAKEWLKIFDKVKQYIFDALIDPKLHLHSTQIIKRFWYCSVEQIATGSVEGSRRMLIQSLRALYSHSDAHEDARVDEAAVLQFLRDLRYHSEEMQMEITNILDAFRETHPDEYASSQLDTVFA